MLANEYLNSSISIKELSEKYHTDAAYQLTKHGIQLKGRGVQKILSRKGCISYKWNASTVDNEEQAYTLGFFMADGHNSVGQAGIKVKSSDYSVLEAMKNCFSEEIKIQNEKHSCSFVISSTAICDNLRNLGIIEHKSHAEKTFPVLRKELERHFIRGYFDGDGTVFICKRGHNPYLKCNICSSTRNILDEIQQVLISNDIQCTINCEKRVGKSYLINGSYTSIATMDMYRLYIRRKASIEKLFHYLYDDATIYLQRKYFVFADNQQMLENKHVNTELTK
jgi:intein/homing endonuclease